MPITHPSGAVRIEADRVYLREFELTDFEQAYEYASDPRVSEYLGSPSTVDQEREFLDRCVVRRAAKPRTMS